MTFRRAHQMILFACHVRQMAMKGRHGPPKWRTWARQSWDFARLNGPKYEPSEWFPGIDTAGQKRLLRAIHDLEAAGLLVTAAEWERLSHIRLTDAGAKEAERLLSKGKNHAGSVSRVESPEPSGETIATAGPIRADAGGET